MRFFIVLLSLCSSVFGSVSYAGVDNLNSLIAESTTQERRLHRKLLHTIQNTQYAIAYNDQIDSLRDQERSRKIEMPVKYLKYTE